MTKYRVMIIPGGYNGSWAVQKRYLFFWRNLSEYSIATYGPNKAYNLANLDLERLTK